MTCFSLWIILQSKRLIADTLFDQAVDVIPVWIGVMVMTLDVRYLPDRAVP